MQDITHTPDWYAEVFNQYRRRLGAGMGATKEEARASAVKAADREISTANPRWKWRKSKIRVFPNPFKTA